MENNDKENKKGWEKKVVAMLISQAISLFGSSLVQFAIIWYVARVTNSGMMVTIQMISAFLPQIIISLFAGVWADRHNRKLIIVLSDSMIAVSTLILAFIMMSGIEPMWLIILISAIRSVGAGIQSPAVSALVPQIVPEEKLMKVNGINTSIQSFINLIAPAVSGALLANWKIYNLMFIDTVTAVIGISILLCVKIGLHEKAKLNLKGGYFEDLKEGLRYSFTHSFIKKTIFIYIVFSILIVPPGFLNVLFVTRVFGDAYIYLTLNEVFFSIGAILGGIILSSWGGFKNRMKSFVFGVLVFGVLTVAIGLINTFWIYLIIMLLTGIGIPFCMTPFMVLLQEKVETDIQGRVFSLISIVASACMPIGMMIFGPMADMMPIQWLLIGSGIALMALAIFIRSYKSYYIQGMPKEIEDN